MTWHNQHSPQWKRVHRSEDILALLASLLERMECVNTHLRSIKRITYKNADPVKLYRNVTRAMKEWEQVAQETQLAIVELQAIQAEEAVRRNEWEAAARGENDAPANS